MNPSATANTENRSTKLSYAKQVQHGQARPELVKKGPEYKRSNNFAAGVAVRNGPTKPDDQTGPVDQHTGEEYDFVNTTLHQNPKVAPPATRFAFATDHQTIVNPIGIAPMQNKYVHIPQPTLWTAPDLKRTVTVQSVEMMNLNLDQAFPLIPKSAYDMNGRTERMENGWSLGYFDPYTRTSISGN